MNKVLDDIIKGIKNGKKAFCGPYTVQIDLTDRCNSSCIACWVHSPLVNKKEVFPQGEKELPFDLVQNLINDLASIDTKEVILSGSGEPLLYGEIIKIIQLIKNKDMRLSIITNAILLDSNTAKVLVDAGADMITASIWAGSPEVYKDTHPGNREEDFAIVKKNLRFFSAYKEAEKKVYPHLKIYNVICSLNYKNIVEMIDFAREVDADSVEFQIVDITKNKTDSLALNHSMIGEIKNQLEKIRNRNDYIEYSFPRDVPVEDMASDNNNRLDFGKIWKNSREGFRAGNFGIVLKCDRGKVLNDVQDLSFYPASFWNTYPAVFRYRFRSNVCRVCEKNSVCLDKNGGVEAKLLNILGVSTFMRRCLSSGVNKGNYDQTVNSIPCYVGWYYARILTSGDVIPCCKAARFPLGNIYNNSFSSIWFSKEYDGFRYKAKNFPKTDPYFSKIECIKSCDNWGSNKDLYERINNYDANIKSSVSKQRELIFIPAKNSIRGNLNKTEEHDFGKDLVLDGGEGWGYAEYEFFLKEGGNYTFWSNYASGVPRPVKLLIDNIEIKKDALSLSTGGWTQEYLKWHKECRINLSGGRHNLKLLSLSFIPHIKSFALGNENSFPDNNIGEAGIGFGFFRALKNKNNRYFNERLKEIFGIFDGKYSYKGPFHVQIDITNDCNNQCIACWCNSPLLGEKKLKYPKKGEYIPLSLVKELIDEIYNMGVAEIYFSGGGEPFMHPEAMKVFEYAKSKKGVVCHINTNFTLLDREKIDRLINMGLDFLTVSTWAGTPRMYTKTHIGRTEDDFLKIKDNLIYLNKTKRNNPKIKLYNVIFSLNYKELIDMVRFAEETSSESLEFTPVDTIPGKTDRLALTKAQRDYILKECEEIKSYIEKKDENGAYVLKNGVRIFGFDQFLRRISVEDDVKEAKYDRNIIDNIPCYIGWLFARIVPEADMHSCLKAHRIPTGSLYTQRFSEIWNSKKQFYFRKKTRVYKKTDKFFRLIGNDPNIKEAGCYKSCDDILRNMWVHRNIKRIPVSLRISLKVAALLSRFAKDAKRVFTPIKSLEYKKYDQDPLIAGILHGRKAFVGPEQVVIDPTNKCNLKCIACWLYSPLLRERTSRKLLNEEIDQQALKRLIKDLACLKTKRVRFTGGGEPFMYKNLIKYIELARKNNLRVSLTTNFTLLQKKEIKEIVDLEVDELCISLWACDGEMYSMMHPGVDKSYFSVVKDKLAYLKSIKTDSLRVTFANVITNINYRRLENMYYFGEEFGADFLYFTIVDIIKDNTDSLLLSDRERDELLFLAEKVKRLSELGGKVKLEFFDGFLKRISAPKEDFSRGNFDKTAVNDIPCYVGWIFARILADGSVAPCCRGVKKIMGNINIQSFKDIWFSSKYNEFRARAKYQKKDTPYFKDIGCVKECDNLMHNQQIHKRLKDIKLV